MTNCTLPVIDFPRCQRRAVQAEFSGGDITSDGGVLLLRPYIAHPWAGAGSEA